MPSSVQRIEKLKRVEGQYEREMLAAIEKAAGLAAQKVHRYARNRTSAFGSRVRDRLYGELRGHYEQLAVELDSLAEDLTGKAAVDWHKAAIEDIEAAGKPVRSSVLRFDRSRIKTYWEMVNPNTERALSAVFTDQMTGQQIRNLRQAHLETFRQAQVEGWTAPEIAKNLQAAWDARAGEMAGDRFVDKAGRTWDNARYLQMTVRTTAARVARDSYMDTLVNNGDDLVQIENVDGEACEICEAWDGVIVSISGASEQYPSYQAAMDAGMFHPNCRCSVNRVDEDMDAEEIERQAETETPDLERAEGETDGAYRTRVTAAVAEYSEGFGFGGDGPRPGAAGAMPRPAEGRARISRKDTNGEDRILRGETGMDTGTFTRRTIDTTRLPDTLDRTVQQTSLAHLKKQPGYDAAKKRGDEQAAHAVVRAVLKQGALENLRARLDLSRPVVFVPVINSEMNDRLNQLPLAYAKRLAESFNGTVADSIVKVSGKKNTDAPQSERLTKEIRFEGALPVKGSQVVIVDDNYTSGRTIMACMEPLKRDGHDVAAVTSLATSRYGAAIKTTPDALDKLRQLVRVSDREIEEVIGHEIEKLTGAEINAITVNGAVRRSGIEGLKRLYSAADGA